MRFSCSSKWIFLRTEKQRLGFGRLSPDILAATLLGKTLVCELDDNRRASKPIPLGEQRTGKRCWRRRIMICRSSKLIVARLPGWFS